MNSKQLSIALGVVVVVLLAIVGYMALRDNSQTDTLSQQNTTPNSNLVDNNTNATQPLNNTNTQKPANSTPPPTDATATWKTYTDSKFSFKYPEKWYVSNGENISNYANPGSYDLGNTPADLESVFFRTEAVNSNSTLDSLKPSNTDYQRVVKFEKFVTTSGVEGRKVVLYSNDHPVGNHSYFYFLKNNEQISFSLGTQSEDQVALLEQILSTFKFAK